jgi:hypothetical protein
MNFKYILIAVFVLVQLSVSYAGVENITEGPHTAKQSLLLSLCGDLQQEILTKWLDDDVKSRATLDIAYTNTVDRPELKELCKKDVIVNFTLTSEDIEGTSLTNGIEHLSTNYKNIGININFGLLNKIKESISKITRLSIDFDLDVLVGDFGYGEAEEVELDEEVAND